MRLRSNNIYKMRSEQNYELLISSSNGCERQLGKLISFIFSNDYIYVHRSFRRLIQQDKKGYICMHELLKNCSIQQYFQEIQMDNTKYRLIFLKATIKDHCPELHYHDGRVRRINPWRRNTMKTIKPVCIREIMEQLSISDVRQYLGEDCFTTNEKIQPKLDEPIFVYGSKLRTQMDCLQQQMPPFLVVRYPQLCKEQARWAKFWQVSEQRFYRPLECLQKKGYNGYLAQHPSHRINEDQSHLYPSAPEDKDLTALSRFSQILKASNPSFNELLRTFIDSSPSNFPSSS